MKFTEKYGTDVFQEGDLYIPNKKPLAILCLYHGGFWLMPYGREQLTPIAIDLARKGFIVWNVEYRRIGAVGGGWHGTFDDVISSINHLKTLCRKYHHFDLTKVVVIGHSAGGQLAIWSGKQYENRSFTADMLQIRPNQIIGLAPVVNLEKAFKNKLGNNSVFQLLGGSPKDVPERYACTDPMRMVPLNTPQLLIHGSLDDELPIEWTRDYVRSTQVAGSDIEYIEINDGGHMDFVDPDSNSISILYNWLLCKYNVSEITK